MDSVELDRMAKEAHELCNYKSLSDIRIDLQKTKSVERTINRILDGGFLEGTSRDPSLSAIIIDSDEDNIDLGSTTRGENDQLSLNDDIFDDLLSTPARHYERSIGSPSSPRESSSKTHNTTRDYIDLRSSPSPPLLPSGANSPLDPIRPAAEADPIYLLSSSTPRDDSQLCLSPPASFDLNNTLHSPSPPPPLLHASPAIHGSDDNHSLLSLDAFMTDLVSSQTLAHNNDLSNSQPSISPSPSTVIDLSDSDPEEFPAITKSLPQKRRIPSSSTPSVSSLPLDFIKEWEDMSESENESEEAPKPPRRRKDPDVSTQPADIEKELKRREREEARERKAYAKKVELQRKKEARDQAKREKEAEKLRKTMLEKANRLGNSRETVLTDMIVDMDTVFAESTRGTLLQEKLREREAEIHITDRQGLYALSWRRRWESEWNDELDAFLPYPDGQKRVKEEHFLLVFLETKDLCDLVEQGENGLDAWAEKLKESAPRKRIMLMTEGLEIYYRKRRTAKRRDFEQQVLHRLDWSAVDGSGGSNRRRRTQADVDTGLGPTKDDIESALTYLQFMQDVMLVPTNDQAETIDWMVAMTAEIARAPYRMVQRRSRQGPARSGLDASDTWNKMLQEIQLCTPAVAKSVATEYPKLQDLHKAYQAKDTQKDREDMLAHLSVERSAISARDRTVNDAMSKKICTVFTSDDPDEVIT